MAEDSPSLFVVLGCLRSCLGPERVAARLREGGGGGVDAADDADNDNAASGYASLLITMGL